MPSKTVVLCTVALTPELVGEHTPRLKDIRLGGAMVPLGGVTPAVTATVQSTSPDRADAERARRGRQRLAVPGHDGGAACGSSRTGSCRRRKYGSMALGITCANLSWWFAMYSSADVTVTPRPMYPADGSKIPDCYTKPGDLRDDLQAELGRFPLFKFWGPAASIDSTKWLAEAAKQVEARFNPDLSLVSPPPPRLRAADEGPGAGASGESSARSMPWSAT